METRFLARLAHMKHTPVLTSVSTSSRDVLSSSGDASPAACPPACTPPPSPPGMGGGQCVSGRGRQDRKTGTTHASSPSQVRHGDSLLQHHRKHSNDDNILRTETIMLLLMIITRRANAQTSHIRHTLSDVFKVIFFM